jgi:ribosomal protein S18 acetylase RimI-like enzyme
LLTDAIAFAREEGYRALTLNTQASNDRSQSLYRAAGFRESGVSLPVYTRVLFEAPSHG